MGGRKRLRKNGETNKTYQGEKIEKKKYIREGGRNRKRAEKGIAKERTYMARKEKKKEMGEGENVETRGEDRQGGKTERGR